MVKIYSVVFGGKDSLRQTNWPVTCLTDNPELKPVTGWSVRHVERVTKDPRRASRHPKMCPHFYFDLGEKDITIYIDGNIELTREDPRPYAEELLRGNDLAVFRHPQRSSVYQEAQKIIEFRKAKKRLVDKQVKRYKAQLFPESFGLSACYVIIRRHTALINEMGERWWAEYMQYCCRDQMSFDYIRWTLDIPRKEIPGNLFKGPTEYFRRRKHG